jgi:hypothetical protein
MTTVVAIVLDVSFWIIISRTLAKRRGKRWKSESYVRFQSATDHQGSTSAAQREQSFPPRLGAGNIGQGKSPAVTAVYIGHD